jgi:hypothetical protein
MGGGSRDRDQATATPSTPSTPMLIEVLYVQACPHAPTVLARLGALLGEAGLEGTIACTRVDTIAQARAARFLGSPTVRVDGRDIDPAAAGRRDYGLGCRLYRGPSGSGAAGVPADVPNDDLLRAALHAAAGSRRPDPATDPATDVEEHR